MTGKKEAANRLRQCITKQICERIGERGGQTIHRTTLKPLTHFLLEPSATALPLPLPLPWAAADNAKETLALSWKVV